jgi:phage major head subunit gpT-like protein
MNITAENLRGIFTAYNLRFQAAFGAAPSFYQELATIVPSTSRSNTYAWMDKLPRMRKWLGDRVVNNLKARGYVIENEKFEMTEAISRDDIEDDQIGVFNAFVDFMSQAAASYPDDLLATLMQNGQTNIAHDGQFFFDIDHPINLDDTGAGVQSNYFTGTPLTQGNFANVRAQMMSWKGSDLQPLGAKPSVLVVPPLLENTARTIVEAELINKGGVQESNVYKGVAKVLVLPQLAGGVGDTEWYLLDNTKPIRPFVFQNRRSPEFVMRNDPQDPSVFDRDEFKYGVSARGAAGYALWFLAAKARA